MTTRGRCMLAAGIAAALCALVLDERDLLRVAAFVTALPLLAALLAGRAQVGLRADRQLVPQRIPVGNVSEAQISVQSTGRFGTGALLLEDGVPAALGGRPRFVIERVRRSATVLLRYPMHPVLRGIHPIGPLVAKVTDPFGLAEYGRELGGHSRLVVTPVVVPLHGMPDGGGLGSGEEGAGRMRSGQGEDDAIVRTYRHGDDLRKVHWRSTARRDELMVRVEERPWRGGAAVLLDHRAGAHRGSGPTASLEYAVSLAASVALHLHGHGQRVRLITEDGRILAGAREVADHTADALLEALAALQPSHQRDVIGGPALAGSQELVAILGATGPAAVEQLLTNRPRGVRGHAILLDVAGWRTSGQEHAADPAEPADQLAAAGWSVTIARPQDPLWSVWQRLCDQSHRRHSVTR